MKIIKLKVTVITALLLISSGASGQYTEEVNFSSDGFSGRIKVEIKRGYYMEPYFNGFQKGVSITGYKERKYDNILAKAGITFPHVLEKAGGYEISGTAIIAERNVLTQGYAFFESVPVSFSTSGNIGSGQVFPPFSDKAKEWLVKKGTEKSIVGKGLSGGEAAWKKYGSINDIKVTRVYLTDFKNRVEALIRDYESDEKDRKGRFKALISQTKAYASGFNFEAAEKNVEAAKTMAGDSGERQLVADTEMFIKDKRKEKEKEEDDKDKKGFQSLITQAKSFAGAYNFEAAGNSLAEAEKLAKDASYSSAIREVKNLISEKQQEKEDKDKKAAEGKTVTELCSEARKALWKGDLEKAKPLLEKAYQLDPTNKTMIDLSQQYAKLKEEKDKKEQEYKIAKRKIDETKKAGQQTVYYPKTNKQLYQELKSMTDANPAMLNDPKMRSQLREYKTLADQDDRNLQDLKTYEVISGGRYNPTASNYLSRSRTTNQNIATAERAVGAAVDAATSTINSIIEERERQQKQRTADYRRAEDRAKAKKEAISEWEDDLLENRRSYETKTKKAIEGRGYTVVAIASGQAIKYESEKYVKGDGYRNGNRYYYNDPTFEKITKVLDHRKLYVVKQKKKYGILGDAGESVYPPQFDDVVTFRSGTYYTRFLVKIKEKWGEIFVDGKVLNDIKYDGIWYLPNCEKLFRLGSKWFGQSFKESNDSEIVEISPDKFMPVLKSSQYTKTVEEKDFPEWILSTADGEIQNAKIEKTHTILDDYNVGKVLIHKLNNHWYKQSFSRESQRSAVVKMPAVFMEKIRGEGKYDKSVRKTIYKWGAINQAGKMILPVKYDRLVINHKNQTAITEDGLYNSSGKLIRSINFSEYKSVLQFDTLGIMWYEKPMNPGRNTEAGIFDEEFNIVYKNEFRSYYFKEENLFEAYASSLVEKNPELMVKIYEVLGKKSSTYYNDLGNIFIKAKPADFNKAFQYFNFYLASYKDIKTADINTIRKVAQMYQEGRGTTMDKQKAILYYAAGMNHKKYYDVPLIVSYVECLLETGDISKAKDLYTRQTKLKRLNKKEAYYYYLAGYLFEKAGNLKKARSKYKTGIKKTYSQIYGLKMEERLKNL